MNHSIIFSLYLLRMSKKMAYFLRNLVRRERMIPWFNINPIPFIHRNDTWWINSRFPSCGFAFAFDRHAKSFTFSCNACSSGWSSGTSVSLLFESITNLFDPWEILTQEWVVFTQRPNSNLNSVFAIQATGRYFQHGSNFCVSLDPPFWLWWSIISWKSVFTTSYCIKLHKNVKMFEPQTIHMPYLHNTCFQSSSVVVDSVCTDVTRHARWSSRRCQAQIVAQDTEQKHGKHKNFKTSL